VDKQTDNGPRQQPEHHIVDGLPDIAKVRVAGSNPVVRSRKTPVQAPFLWGAVPRRRASAASACALRARRIPG